MKTRIFTLPVLGLFLAVLGAPTLNWAAEKAAAETTPLEDKMEDINAAYRKLNRQISDATKNADSLKQVGIMRDSANAALKLEPKKKAEVPAGDQAKFLADYQTHMKEFIANIGKVETALKANKNEEAAAALKSLKQDQEEGHKMFKKDKKKK
jgi:soluble cytochrome b562